MKKCIALILVLAGLVMAADRYEVETEVLSFANETAAKTDTLQSSDSAFCVIYQGSETRGVPNKISIYLPDILDSGDSAKVFVRELLTHSAGRTRSLGVNKTSRNLNGAENARAANSTGANVYKSHEVGAYSYGDGPLGAGGTVITYSPVDSIFASRVEIVLVEWAGTPVITGMDSLHTSPIFIEKLFVK